MGRDLCSCRRDGNRDYGAVEQLLSSLGLGELSKSFVAFQRSWCLRHRRDIRVWFGFQGRLGFLRKAEDFG